MSNTKSGDYSEQSGYVQGRFSNKREFEHNGEQVTEIIVANWTSDQDLLLWCRTPFEQTVVNGKINPCFHYKFNHGSKDSEEAAREKVQWSFDNTDEYNGKRIR